LLVSWGAAVSLCVISAGILGVRGPRTGVEETALQQQSLPGAIPTAKITPATAAADAQATAEPALVAIEVQMVKDEGNPRTDLPPKTSTPAVTQLAAAATPPVPAVIQPAAEAKNDAAGTAARDEKHLNLRITRDSERCPKVVCYRWHLVTQRLKPPPYTKVDLAGLRLAPSLRRGVDNGDIDLIIEAVAQRKTINGHDTLVFVATNLSGVTPHDGPL
jgi:hypothetical protein